MYTCILYNMSRVVHTQIYTHTHIHIHTHTRKYVLDKNLVYIRTSSSTSSKRKTRALLQCRYICRKTSQRSVHPLQCDPARFPREAFLYHKFSCRVMIFLSLTSFLRSFYVLLSFFFISLFAYFFILSHGTCISTCLLFSPRYNVTSKMIVDACFARESLWQYFHRVPVYNIVSHIRYPIAKIPIPHNQC